MTTASFVLCLCVCDDCFLHSVFVMMMTVSFVFCVCDDDCFFNSVCV